MPTQDYRLDGPTLALSTTITGPLPSASTAPDGYYSDGVIVRQLTGGVLLPAEPCDECLLACGQPLYVINASTNAHLVVGFDMGVQNGAVIVTIETDGRPIGALMTMGSLSSGIFSSTGQGRLLGNDENAEVYVGDSGDACTPSGTYSPLTISEYRAGSMIDIGTESKTVDALQLDLTAGSPGTLVGVMSKGNNNHTKITVDLYALCTPTQVSVKVSCPTLLPSFIRSASSPSGAEACVLQANLSGYYVHVSGSGGQLAVNDFVFSDPSGASPLSDGFYLALGFGASYDYIEVQDGVIVSTGLCSSGGRYYAQRCLDGLTKTVYSAVTLSLGETLFLVEEDCLFHVTGFSTAAIDATISSIESGSCSDNCVFVEFENTSLSPITLSYSNCAGSPLTLNIPAGEKEYRCVNDFDPSPVGLQYQILDCDCDNLNKYEAELCGDPSASTVVVGSVDTLSVGDLVLLDSTASNSDCYYVITGSSVATRDHLVISSRSDITCSDLCVSLQVENTSGVQQTILFDDCTGAQVEMGLDDGEIVTICAKSGTLTAPLCTVTYQGCNC